MKVLILGQGAREHALQWAVNRTSEADRCFCLPGNGGTSDNVDGVSINDFKGILRFVRENRIDLTAVGPEAPLIDGIADEFRREGHSIFGPGRRGAMLEGSKSFAKHFMMRHGIPTAGFEVFNDFSKAASYYERHENLVIKEDQPAAGKGVHLPDQKEAGITLLQRLIDRENKTVLLEEELKGSECSVISFTDGGTIRPLTVSRDHKRAYDEDKGPNTGGMGAYAPVPDINPELFARIERDIIQPFIRGLIRDQIDYKGFIYFGLMLTKEGPRVLEFNCRMGDPEAQVILPLFNGNLVETMDACIRGELNRINFSAENKSCLCVVLASGGYPGNYMKGCEISGTDQVKDALVFHAGTRRQDGCLVTSGGRVLSVTGKAENIISAARKAYNEISKIHFHNSFYRTDIGKMKE